MNRRITTVVISSLAAVAILFGASAPAQAAARTHTVYSHTGYGKFKSSVKTIRADKALKVTYSSSCTSNNYTFNFTSISWNGKPGFDFDYLWRDFSGRSAHGSDYLYADVRKGYFEISEQANCKTTIKVTQRY